MSYSIKVFTFNVPKKGTNTVLYFKMLITYVQNF